MEGQSGSLLHVVDTLTNQKWLVDGGALLSIVPPTYAQKLNGPNDTPLQAANGSIINCYGTTRKKIAIGDRTFDFNFVIADVRQRILGADFLSEFYLAPNHRDGSLLDLANLSESVNVSNLPASLPATLARGVKSNPINFVNQADNPYYKLLDSFPDVLTPSFTITEPKHGVKHHIPTSGRPVQSRARKLDPEKLAIAKAELDKLCKLGICHRAKSAWSSPLHVTTKPCKSPCTCATTYPCGGWRVCGDYRRLNNQTEDDKYPVRTLTDFNAELHGKKVFSKIDLLKGYHQIPVAEEDVGKTGVITPFGLFVFPRTPFGLKNAGQDFQWLMDEVLGEIPRVFVYLDDILVASETPEQHLADLETVFKTLADNGLVVNRPKCILGQSSLEFLGHHVDATGIAPLPHRVEAISNFERPTSVKELQRFLGMINYYRRFIPKAAHHLYPLFDVLKGKPKLLKWSDDCQRAFDAIKKALAAATLLHHPRPGPRLALTTDASNFAIGAVLEQRGKTGWEPLGFYSAKLQPNQKDWPPYDRELLAVFRAVRHFKPMIEGRPFTIFTDHQSLVPSMAKKTDSPTARQTYQLSCISEFTTDIQYVMGKANVVADALSRPPEKPPLVSNLAPAGVDPASIKNPQWAPTGSSNAGGSGQQHLAERSLGGLNLVVNAIGRLGVDLEEMANEQPLDQDFARLSSDSKTGLHFKNVDLGSCQLAVDVSNGPARPFVPFAWRRRVFDAIHGLGHPGVERTRKSIADKFVWPSMREDCSKWARQCVQCQQAKVVKNTTPPIGNFVVPQKRFSHINLDLVGPLPASNGNKYILTAVDRFTRWPMAVPLKDASTQSVIDAFAHNWIANFGVPAAITTDRGGQFKSAVWKQLLDVWGIKAHLTTSYHPASNGLVERFHRRLKESLLALGTDRSSDWFWRLPCTLLSIRTTLKPDVNASPADLVYGEGLSVPGDLLPASVPSENDEHLMRRSALQELRLEVSRLQPTRTSAHRQPRLHVPLELQSATHVFVRRGGVQPALTTPYTGPYRVISREANSFKLALPGHNTEVVSIERLKPAFISSDDEQIPNDPPKRRCRVGATPRRPDPDSQAAAPPGPSSAPVSTTPREAPPAEIPAPPQPQPRPHPQDPPGPPADAPPQAQAQVPRFFSDPRERKFSKIPTRPSVSYAAPLAEILRRHLEVGDV